MIEYEVILKSVESQKMRPSYSYTMTNLTQYLQHKKIGYYERFQVLGILLSYYSMVITNKQLFLLLVQKLGKKKIGTEKVTIRRRAMRSLLIYFLQTHVRKKIETLHKLYRREVIAQYKEEANLSEIEQLRNIAEDLQNYRDLLPNTKKVIGTFIAAISTIIVIIDFVGLKPLIFDALKSVTIDWVFLILIVGYIVTFYLATPIVQTFVIKRTLLLKSNSWHHYLDIYLDKGKKVYGGSIYKLEDNLFEILGVKNRKPKERPVDLIILFTIRGLLIGVVIVGMIIRIVENFLGIVPISSSDWSTILTMSLVVAVFGFFYFIGPYLEYKRRINYHLL